MGWNDRIDDSELCNLPEEAFGNRLDTGGPFDPNDNWLKRAKEDEQRIAVKEWFLARYCDPAMETPYNGREGGYLFIQGGPYDPSEELHERFSGVVPDVIIDGVVQELYDEVGDMWAPIRREPDYDEYLEFLTESPDKPRSAFNQRINEIEKVLNLTNQTDQKTAKLIEQMTFGSVITAVEAYLAEISTYWVVQDEPTMQRVASKVYKDEKFSLADVFDHPEKFKNNLLEHLGSKVVWHRLDKLKPTLEHGLKISLPGIGDMMAAVNKRHDIVHRAGRTKDGQPIEIDKEQVEDLCSKSRQFVSAVDDAISTSYQPNKSGQEEF